MCVCVCMYKEVNTVDQEIFIGNKVLQVKEFYFHIK